MTDNNLVGITIAACEIGFWVILGLGLLARYGLRQRRAGLVLLACTPVVDVVLLLVAAIDLHRGGHPQWTHGLSALYLGYSIVFGPAMIRWIDVRVAHRFAGGPPPRKIPKHGPVRLRHEWREFGRAVTASIIAVAISGVLIAIAHSDQRADAVAVTLPRIGVVLGIWFVAGPLWEVLTPSKQESV